ncbi:DUF4283 domain protein [Medicago truncatula]|uniref:DUF4283 domain protein n=1 Tax=Medicago truncatula TaxID=3880 RepID=A0A072TVC2_MEDTR|nr:DUF4283 domain protein [Medicago truncatula]
MPFDWQAELASPASLLSVPVHIVPIAAASATVAQLTAPPKSFAAAVGDSRSPTEVPPYPVPCIKGDSLSIRICQDEYVKGLEDCQYALRGRLTLSKGDKPYTARDLASKLGKIWKILHQWKMVPLGRGFYDFLFENHDDFNRTWTAGTISLQPGLLRLSQWTKDFNHNAQTQTHASLWIRLVALPHDYWRERTLKEIASAVGTPISIDGPTRNRAFGHYARILVDIDLSKRVYDEILVEREGFTFNVEVVKVPDCGKKQVTNAASNPPRVGKGASSSATLCYVPLPKAIETHVVVPTPTANAHAVVPPPTTETCAAVPQQQLPSPIILHHLLSFHHQLQPVRQQVPLAATCKVFLNLFLKERIFDGLSLGAKERGFGTDLDRALAVLSHHTAKNRMMMMTLIFFIDEDGTATAAPKNTTTSIPLVLAAVQVPDPLVVDSQDDNALSIVVPEKHNNDRVQHDMELCEKEYDMQVEALSGSRPSLASPVVVERSLEASASMTIPEAQDAQENVVLQQQHVHPSKNIQHSLDLWDKVREYDARSAAEDFTPVLTRKQTQKIKVQQVLAKQPPKTRARGDNHQTAQ